MGVASDPEGGDPTMSRHLTVLADQDRVELFGILGRPRRLFRDAETWTDSDGIAWTGTRLGTLGLGLTWLGPGWTFDAQARREREEEYEQRLRAVRDAAEVRHRGELGGRSATFGGAVTPNVYCGRSTWPSGSTKLRRSCCRTGGLGRWFGGGNAPTGCGTGVET